jgi:hypothetical protein
MLLFYLFVAYGLCFGFQNKLPFLYSDEYLETQMPDRFTDSLLHCTYCTGFHTGWMTWFLLWAVSGEPYGHEWGAIPAAITFAFASAGFCYAVDALVKWAEANTVAEDE